MSAAGPGAAGVGALRRAFDPLARAAPDAEGLTSPATQAFRAERRALVAALLARGVAPEAIEVTLTREPERTLLRVCARPLPAGGRGRDGDGGAAARPAARAPGPLHPSILAGDL